MGKISMVMFDLSGTTVYDDTGVRDCLYKAAQEFDLETTPDEILLHMGTNKIHLYQFLIARSQGKQIDIKDFEKIQDPDTYELAKKTFDRYEELMIRHYRAEVREIPGAADTFRWCHEHGIKVATDTGFHHKITQAIMDGLGWIKDGLVDLSVDVESIPGDRGRPAPYMIFYAMQELNIQSVHEVIKVGDTPADMLEGRNAGCRGVVGVLSGPRPISTWGMYWHTHLIPSVKELPELITSEFECPN
ncbi:MAG: HAD hydrolase-like protein [Desulfobacterales bacterium]|jgi:phosphonatase-like hydrolase